VKGKERRGEKRGKNFCAAPQTHVPTLDIKKKLEEKNQTKPPRGGYRVPIDLVITGQFKPNLDE